MAFDTCLVSVCDVDKIINHISVFGIIVLHSGYNMSLCPIHLLGTEEPFFGTMHAYSNVQRKPRLQANALCE